MFLRILPACFQTGNKNCAWPARPPTLQSFLRQSASRERKRSITQRTSILMEDRGREANERATVIYAGVVQGQSAAFGGIHAVEHGRDG